MEFLVEFSSLDEKNLLYLFGILIGLIFTLIFYIQKLNNDERVYVLDKILINETSISSYTDKFEETLKSNPSIYKDTLSNILDKLDRYLGELKLFSGKAFNNHFILAFIYSFFFFYILWLFGVDSNIGTINILPNEDRLSTTLYLISEIIFLYLLFSPSYFSMILSEKNKILKGVLGVLFLFIFIFITVFLVQKIGGGLAGVGLILTLILLGVGIGVVVVPIGILGLVGIGGMTAIDTLVFLFCLILPTINAIFDYISMIISRYFSQKILIHSKIKIMIDIFFDLIIAFVLLWLLALTLDEVISLVNLYIIPDENYYIPIESYKAQLLINPFDKDVLWITLMLFSTLTPTLIHFGLGLYSFVLMLFIKPHHHKIYEGLKTLNPENQHEKDIIAKGLAEYRLAKSIGLATVALIFLSALFLVTLISILIKMKIIPI